MVDWLYVHGYSAKRNNDYEPDSIKEQEMLIKLKWQPTLIQYSRRHEASVIWGGHPSMLKQQRKKKFN